MKTSAKSSTKDLNKSSDLCLFLHRCSAKYPALSFFLVDNGNDLFTCLQESSMVFVQVPSSDLKHLLWLTVLGTGPKVGRLIAKLIL